LPVAHFGHLSSSPCCCGYSKTKFTERLESVIAGKIEVDGRSPTRTNTYPKLHNHVRYVGAADAIFSMRIELYDALQEEIWQKRRFGEVWLGEDDFGLDAEFGPHRLVSQLRFALALASH